MKIRFIVLCPAIICMLVITGMSQAQNRESVLSKIESIDSLLSDNQDSLAKISIDVLANNPTIISDSEIKMRYQILLGDYYLSQNRYDESIEAFLPVAEVITNGFRRESQLQKAKAVNDLGIAYMKVGSIREAIKAHHASLRLYRQFDDPQGSAYNYNNLAVIYKELKKIDSAILFHSKSIEFAIQANDSIGIGFNNLNIGVLHADNKRPIKAMDHLQQALKVFEEINNKSLVVATQRRLGVVYRMIKDYESAARIHQQVLAYYSQRESKAGLANTHIDIGEMLLKINKDDSAKYHIDKGLEISQELNLSKALSKGFSLLGQYFVKVNNYDEAYSNYSKSLEISSDKFVGMEGNNLVGLGRISYQRGGFTKANGLVLEALDKIEYSASPTNLSGAYELLYLSYKALGNQSEALKYLELHNEQRNLIFSEDQSLEIARIEYRNRLEREKAVEQERQIAKELAYKQEIARERWMRFGAASLAILVGLIALFAYRSYRIKKAANLQLSEKNDVLKELRIREKKLSEEAISSKERELATMAMATHEKNALLKDLEQKVSFIQNRIEDSELKPSLKVMQKTITEGYSLDSSWDSFIHKFEDVHPQFFDKLKKENGNLTIDDLKLCAYLKIGMSNKEIANVTHLALTSIKSRINRLKKKLEMRPEDDLRDYMLKYG